MTNCEEALKYYQDKDKEKKDKKMTSYEFEVCAKNAVVTVYAKAGFEVNYDSLNVVWAAHILGNKKCLIWGVPMGKEYAEVTYNSAKNELYVDIVVDQHYVSDYYERKAKELNCEMLEHLKTKNERLKAELQKLEAEGKSLDNINIVAGLYTEPSVR